MVVRIACGLYKLHRAGSTLKSDIDIIDIDTGVFDHSHSTAVVG